MLREHRRLFRLGVLLGLLLTTSSPTRAQAPLSPSELDRAARSEFEQGASAYEQGHFAEALLHYERAYVLSPRPKLLFNIGRAAESEGKLERAIEAYGAYLEAEPGSDNRPFVEARLQKLRARRDASRRGETYVAQPAPAAPYPEPYTSPYTMPSAPLAAERALEPGRFRFYVGGHTGVRGSIDLTASGQSWSERYGLGTTFGLQLGAGYEWRFAGIGLEARVSSFGLEIDGVEGRRPLLSILAKPRGGYTFRRVPLMLYGSIPVGVGIPTGDDLLSTGVSLQLGVGATYFFSRHLGLNAEAALGGNFLPYASKQAQLPHSFEPEQGWASSQELMLSLSAVLAL